MFERIMSAINATPAQVAYIQRETPRLGLMTAALVIASVNGVPASAVTLAI